MVNIANGNWIADLGAMTCRNIENGAVVAFKRKGKIIEGEIKDMPIEIIERWAALPNGEERIRRMVEEAEEVFLRAWFESRIEREGSKNI
jgi:hypothetical protein